MAKLIKLGYLCKIVCNFSRNAVTSYRCLPTILHCPPCESLSRGSLKQRPPSSPLATTLLPFKKWGNRLFGAASSHWAAGGLKEVTADHCGACSMPAWWPICKSHPVEFPLLPPTRPTSESMQLNQLKAPATSGNCADSLTGMFFSCAS